jgi:hypothetical protein
MNRKPPKPSKVFNPYPEEAGEEKTKEKFNQTQVVKVSETPSQGMKVSDRIERHK